MIRLDPNRNAIHGPRGTASVSEIEYRLLRALLMPGFARPVSHADLVDAGWPVWKPSCGYSSLGTAFYRLRATLRHIGGAEIIAFDQGKYAIFAVPTRAAVAKAA